jgi:hypothetical protein
MRVRYDGGFSLANAPGGGMNARLMWTVAGVPGWQVSEDIVVYPGWNDVDLDLFTWPLGAVNEADLGGGAGWIGQTITNLRIDFHEDPGRRFLDDVTLWPDTRPARASIASVTTCRHRRHCRHRGDLPCQPRQLHGTRAGPRSPMH